MGIFSSVFVGMGSGFWGFWASGFRFGVGLWGLLRPKTRGFTRVLAHNGGVDLSIEGGPRACAWLAVPCWSAAERESERAKERERERLLLPFCPGQLSLRLCVVPVAWGGKGGESRVRPCWALAYAMPKSPLACACLQVRVITASGFRSA